MKSMTTVMDRKIGAHLKAIDPIIGRKRVFAFMADKVTELHMTGDAVAFLVRRLRTPNPGFFPTYPVHSRTTNCPRRLRIPPAKTNDL